VQNKEDSLDLRVSLIPGPLPLNVTLQPRWLRPATAAKYAGLSKSYIYPAISDGRIRSACLRAHNGASRGIRLIDRVSLDEFLAAHTENNEVRLAREREKLTLRAEILSNAQARLEEKKAALESRVKCSAARPNPEILRRGVRTPLDD
jgi:excisionase family DNA binding protein